MFDIYIHATANSLAASNVNVLCSSRPAVLVLPSAIAGALDHKPPELDAILRIREIVHSIVGYRILWKESLYLVVSRNRLPAHLDDVHVVT